MIFDIYETIPLYFIETKASVFYLFLLYFNFYNYLLFVSYLIYQNNNHGK